MSPLLIYSVLGATDLSKKKGMADSKRKIVCSHFSFPLGLIG